MFVFNNFTICDFVHSIQYFLKQFSLNFTEIRAFPLTCLQNGLKRSSWVNKATGLWIIPGSTTCPCKINQTETFAISILCVFKSTQMRFIALGDDVVLQSGHFSIRIFSAHGCANVLMLFEGCVSAHLGVDSYIQTVLQRWNPIAFNAEFLSSILASPRISELTFNAYIVLYSSNHMYCTLRC